jgi:predicted transcriptional regulator
MSMLPLSAGFEFLERSGRLVVVDNGKLVGLITHSGVMRFMQIRAQLEAKTETK